MDAYTLYIDEAGRGPLAGPLYAGVIMTTQKYTPKGFKDSKLLSPENRKKLFHKIQLLAQQKKIYYAYGYSTHKEIDAYGITTAILLAICRGIHGVVWSSTGSPLPEQVFFKDLQKALKNAGIQKCILDGNHDFGISKKLKITTKTIIHGDRINKSLSMASIIAKVNRDRHMMELAKQYPTYQFDIHKGYATQLHRQLLEIHGICEIHRKLFLKELFPDHRIRRRKSSKRDFNVVSIQ